ncbi:MAG: HEAT repeat domain-containing protein [bacterium]|nr:HEAT repeat domain-containing protein [bacterium]
MKALFKVGTVLALAFMLIVGVSSTGISQEKSEKEYNDYLIKALSDSNVGIRSSAAQLLGERKVEEAVKPLVKMLDAEKHYAVRITAALALYQIGGDDAKKALKEKMKDEKHKTVKHVLAGLIEDMNNVKVAKK